MPQVNILSPDVVSKIAAGEVVERPASVVKELIENSIDADATSIEVTLVEAGKTLIKIKDDGHGIELQDLEKLFHRHATSKIKESEDLYNILSLGFRGEALYSIAAVSDIILRTRTKNDDQGWEVHLRGGQRISLKPCTFAGHGTEIEIKELFFNTPARKKFLKATQTEIQQVLNIFIPYTLIHSEIRFKLIHQDRALIDVAPNRNLAERIAQILHLEHKDLLDAKQDFTHQKCCVRVVLGDMNLKRSRRDLQFIFINGRPVFNKTIAFHVNQIYRLVMPEESYPMFCVYLQMPSEDIDVNIHPTKREVKLRDEQSISYLIRNLCEQTLMTMGKTKEVTMGATLTSDQPSVKVTRYDNTIDYSPTPEGVTGKEFIKESTSDYAYPRSNFPPIQPSRSAEKQEYFIPSAEIFNQKQDGLQKKLSEARYVGPFINKFLLFESGNSLLIVDQHAAQERIMYEHFIVQLQKGKIEVQHLLSPITLKLTVQEMLVWEEAKEKLSEAGFETTQWDKQSIAIHAHPQLVKDAGLAVQQLLSGDAASFDHDAIAKRACRASIMAGDKLAKEQADYQKDQLLKCLDPFTCPHGRPTVIELTETFLDKQFLRT